MENIPKLLKIDLTEDQVKQLAQDVAEEARAKEVAQQEKTEKELRIEKYISETLN